jgi:hypothetical protein
MYFELFLFQMAALVAGSLLSYFKPNHKMVMGFLVIVVGILELVFLAGFLFYIVGFFYFTGFLTTLLRIAVVFMSSKYAK